MANGTRSGRKWKDEDNENLKTRHNGIREKEVKGSTTSKTASTDTSGLRRSARESPSKKQSRSIVLDKRKTERLSKQTQPTPPSRRKSERVGNQRMLSPQRRSARGNKRHQSLSSLGTKKLEKKSTSLDTQKKEEKRENNGKRVRLDDGEISRSEKRDPKGAGVKVAIKKRLDARSYRALFKPQGKKLKKQDVVESTKGDCPSQGEKSKNQDEDDEGEKSKNQDEDDEGEKSKNQDYSSKEDGDYSGPRSSKEVEEGGVQCSGREGDGPKGNNIGETGKGVPDESSTDSRKVAENIPGIGGKLESDYLSKKRKLCYGKADESKYGGSLLESSPDRVMAEETVDNAVREQVDCSAREDLQTLELMESTSEGVPVAVNVGLEKDDTVGVLKRQRSSIDVGSDDSLQSSAAGVKAKEIMYETDRAQRVCSTEKDLRSPEIIESASDGRLLDVDTDVETVNQFRDFKRKRSAADLDSDTSVTAASNEICPVETPSVGIVSPSSPGIKKSKSFGTCGACVKQQRVDCNSKNQDVCSCNAKAAYASFGVSIYKEGSEQVPTLRSPPNDEIAGSYFQGDRAKRSLDARAQLDEAHEEAQKENNGLPDSHTKGDITVPPEEDRGRFEVRNDKGVIAYGNSADINESSSDIQTDVSYNVCVTCTLGGKLLSCDGKGCRRSYHIFCHDPPLKVFPPGAWYCLCCVKKKIELGVHSVSEGAESIWDAREVEISDGEGMQKEKQYLVKYKGLAHVHNCWIPETQMLKEAPILVAKFNRKNQKGKVARWKSEWTVPQRLLQKRLAMSSKQTDECFEWFVKWNGLGYEHATWELESASFLSSPEGMLLIRDYESRHEKAKKASDPSRAEKGLQERKDSFSKLQKLSSRCLPGIDNDHLSSVNKLREYWHKCQNAVVIDDQERIMKIVLFILSLQSDVCRPFLIITTSSSLSVWEAEFMHLAPSINAIVYSGSRDVRESIRALEFYEEGGCVMFQVLLTPPDVIVEDLEESLGCLGWEAIIVDECQRSRVSKHFNQISSLASDFRLLLVNGQIKDNIPEYLNLLSFLNSGGMGIGINDLGTNSDDNIDTLAALKERLAHHVANEHKADSSKFVEYWVPVRLSIVQLEQYCATLLSNSISLCSCSKNDLVGALRDILISTRKCCDHPYLVDESLQMALTKGLPEVEYLDVGVNASGKLQLLDKFLLEVKNRGLRVLILFQSIGGSGRTSIGDILDDFLRQRFGADSYERVDSGLLTSRKHAALNMFNNKMSGRFVFLLENRACHPSIKLSSVDAVIIYNSDWNPLNDLRSLQRINLDSQFEQIKLFRLYSFCTLEEKILSFAKQDMIRDSGVQHISRGISHMLLIWGASSLFKKLDEFHAQNSLSLGPNDQSLLNDAVREFSTLLSQEAVSNSTSQCSLILKAHQSGTAYSRNISLLGEQEMQLVDGDPPHDFWKKLLERRYPLWKYPSVLSPRVRRKVNYFDTPPKKPESENEEVKKKCKKAVSNSIDPLTLKSWLEVKRKVVGWEKEARTADAAAVTCSSNGSPLLNSWLEDKRGVVCCEKEPKMANAATVTRKSNGSSYISQKKAIRSGSSETQAGNGSDFPRSLANGNELNHHSPPTVHGISDVSAGSMVESDGRRKLREAQKNLHLLLKPEISKLCEILEFPEGVKGMAGMLLEYIMNNHHVTSEPVAILHAFEISLCWAASSFLKHKVDHNESLMLAKKHLGFECKMEEADSVYTKLRMLKKMFLSRNPALMNGTQSFSQKEQLSAPGNQDTTRHLGHTEIPELEKHSSAPGNLDTPRYLPHTEIPKSAADEKDLEEGEIRESSEGYNCTQTFVEQEKPPDCEEAPVELDLRNGIGSQKSESYSRRIEKFCAKRTGKILQKQQDEVEEFNKFRRVEKKKLEKNYSLERDLIGTIHNNHSVRSDKLKILDENFAKKVDEHNKNMDVYHKKLVAMQLHARQEEQRRKACWMEEAKSGRLVESLTNIPLADSGFRMACKDTCKQYGVSNASENTTLVDLVSSGSQNLDVGVSESVASRGSPAEIPVVVLDEATQEMSVKTVTPSSILNADSNVNDGLNGMTLDGMAAAGVEQHTTADTIDDTHLTSSLQENIIELSSLTQLNATPGPDILFPSHQVQHSGQHGQLDGSSERSEHVPSSEGLTSRKRVVVLALPPINPVPLQSEQSDHNAHNEMEGSSELRREYVPSSEGPISPQQAEVLDLQPINPVLLQSEQADHNAHNQLEGSSELRSEHVPSSEGPISSQQVEDLALQPINSVLLQSEQSDHNAICPEQMEVVSLESNYSVPAEVDPSDYLMRSPQLIEFPTPQPGDPVLLQVEQSDYNITSSQSTLPLQLPSTELPSAEHNQPNVSSASTGSEHESSVFAQQTEVITQPLVETISSQTEQFNHLTESQPPLGTYTSLEGGTNRIANRISSGSLLEPVHRQMSGIVPEFGYRPSQHSPLNNRLPRLAQPDPLEHELIRICREEDQAIKMHDDKKILLKSECEREIEEIRRKYTALLNDEEMGLIQKRKTLEANFSKVYLNRVLAEAFKFRFSDAKSGATTAQQGAPSSFMQQFFCLYFPHVAQPSQATQLAASASNSVPASTPAPSLTVASVPAPAPPAARPAPAPSAARPAPAPPATPSRAPTPQPSTPPVQVVHHSSALFSSSPLRPYHFPSVPSHRNLQVGSEVRAPAPHLRPFRPTMSAAASNPPHLPGGMPSWSFNNPAATTSNPPTYPSGGAHNLHISGASLFHNSSLSALELLMDMDGLHGTNAWNQQLLQASGLMLSGADPVGGQGPTVTVTTQTAAATDVICLSDDE